MTNHRLSIIFVSVICIASRAYADQQYINGMFVYVKGSGPTELIAWAEANSRGQLRMQQGSLEDAPVVHEIEGIFTSIPLWRPVRVFVSTEHIFHDDRAEVRHLAIASRVMNVYTLALRVADLERRAKINSLLTSVRASADMPGYAFVVLRSSGISDRYYPIRLTPDER